MNGQLKKVYPRWEGFDSIINYLDGLEKFYLSVRKKSFVVGDLINNQGSNYWRRMYHWSNTLNREIMNYEGYYSYYLCSEISNIIGRGITGTNDKDLIGKILQDFLPITSRYEKIVDSLYKLKRIEFSDLTKYIEYFKKVKESFSQLKSQFLNKFYYYAKILRRWGQILTMIYFCLLLSFTFFACVSMMFYSCLRNQGYLSTFMHVLWNIIRFFMFSFFIYGAAYGMCYLALRDAIAVVMYIFGEENLSPDSNLNIIPSGEGKDYLNYCLIGNDNDYKNRLDERLTVSLIDFFTNYKELQIILETYQDKGETYYGVTTSTNTGTSYRVPYNFGILFSEKTNMITEIKNYILNSNTEICKTSVSCGEFPELTLRQGGIFGSFNCSFLKAIYQ